MNHSRYQAASLQNGILAGKPFSFFIFHWLFSIRRNIAKPLFMGVPSYEKRKKSSVAKCQSNSLPCNSPVPRITACLAFITVWVTFLALNQGVCQERDKQALTKELEEIARVATIMVDGDVCQRIMTERALKKMFTIDPKDPWAGADNFDVNAEPYIQIKKTLIRLARLAPYPVDCNLWMPFKEEPGKIQVLIRNQYEMSQFWNFGELYADIYPEMKEVLTSGKPLTVQKSGNIVSIVTPVHNSLGDIVGLVEVVSQAKFNPQENVK